MRATEPYDLFEVYYDVMAMVANFDIINRTAKMGEISFIYGFLSLDMISFLLSPHPPSEY